jgi:hypothetical protein
MIGPGLQQVLGDFRMFAGRESHLRVPIVDGPGQVTAGVQVVPRQFEVGLEHFRGAVTEGGLQDVVVAAVGPRLCSSLGNNIPDMISYSKTRSHP